MKKLSGLVVTIMLGLTVSAQTNLDFVPLKEIFKNDFLIGVAVSGRTITGDAGNMVIGNFNTITCENEMKPQSLLYFPS
ncbi:MAG: endo-1,4-beta-xylanase, partial [Bacteroidales bacterium]|nr:endo-1,4-beta-xylanase [Bacteroidales bacterium]